MHGILLDRGKLELSQTTQIEFDPSLIHKA